MKDFITKHAPRPNQKSFQKSFRKILSATSYNIQNYDSKSDYFNAFGLNYNDEKLYLQENIDLSLIHNPTIHAKKGASCKTQFKGSQEIKQKNTEQKTIGQKPTECQQCHKLGHNKAGCIYADKFPNLNNIIKLIYRNEFF